MATAAITLHLEIDGDQLRSILAELGLGGRALAAVPDLPGPEDPPPPPSAARRQTVGKAQREVLAWLMDHHGVLSRPEGDCTSLIADDLGLAVNHCSGVLKVLAERGHIERHVHHKKTLRLAITDSGRELIGRSASWSKRPDDRNTKVAKPARAKAPAMPDLGPIGPLGPVDEDIARHGAAIGFTGTDDTRL